MTKLIYCLTNWTLFVPSLSSPTHQRTTTPDNTMMVICNFITSSTHTPLTTTQNAAPPQWITSTAECRWCEDKWSRPKDWELSESASPWTSRPDWVSRWHARVDGKWLILITLDLAPVITCDGTRTERQIDQPHEWRVVWRVPSE